jgi:hypothetical protein
VLLCNGFRPCITSCYALRCICSGFADNNVLPHCTSICNVQEDDPKKFVIARKFENKAGKTVTKRPKIQRLITPVRLQRKRARANVKKQAQEKAKACLYIY